jgi:hypothetical protein
MITSGGNLFKKTTTDLHPEYISAGRKPSGAAENLSVSAMPHLSAPSPVTMDFISAEVIIPQHLDG